MDYELRGAGYAAQRKTDARIAEFIREALGPARIVLNVGAGAGSYEPSDRHVVAVEPSATMRASRPSHLAPAIDATAERLPLDDDAVDASMAITTVHQWSDLGAGLGELRRVTRGPIVIMTFDGDALERFWLAAYAPELIAVERRRYPAIELIRKTLGGRTEVQTVPVSIDCADGFTEAYYARPERFLDPAVRRSQSAWSFLEPGVEDRIVERLRSELASGAWDERYRAWRSMPEFAGSLRLIIGHRQDRAGRAPRRAAK